MTITSKSDEEIMQIAKPMIDEVINASNEKNWTIFSKYQTDEEALDRKNKENVYRLWEEQSFFTSLHEKREVLGVLRRDEVVVLIWKQTSSKISGEYLARYYLKEINNEIKEVGFIID